jgi:hypothetical protein
MVHLQLSGSCGKEDACTDEGTKTGQYSGVHLLSPTCPVHTCSSRPHHKFPTVGVGAGERHLSGQSHRLSCVLRDSGRLRITNIHNSQFQERRTPLLRVIAAWAAARGGDSQHSTIRVGDSRGSPAAWCGWPS